VPKRKRAAPKGVSEKQRADDDQLRESLRTADLRVFDKAIKRAFVEPAPVAAKAKRKKASSRSK